VTNCPTSRSWFPAAFRPNLADDLQRGKLDVAFLRREPKPDLEYRLVRKEPLVVILPDQHPLVRQEAIHPRDLKDQTFIGISDVAPVLRASIWGYVRRSGVQIAPTLEVDNFAMAISLVMTTGGLAILPASVEGYLPPTITSRRLAGEQPTVDLVLGYRKSNASPLLKTFLSRIDGLANQIYKSDPSRAVERHESHPQKPGLASMA
jgi:LysR family hca operon transcriptional activator